MSHPGGHFTTLERTLRAGAARSRGSEREYRRLVYGPGEPRLARDDLAGDDLAGDDLAGELAGPKRDLVSVLNLGHLTDFQIADVQSPGRFEFFEQLRGRPGDESFVPAFRPQESLATHAVAAMVATLNRLPPSPETGAPLGLCISTGDSLDNAQLNELQWFLALLAGGAVAPNSGGPDYEGVQAPGWRPAAYWRPEPGPDPYKDRFGFPAYPGLLAEALKGFRSPGLAIPWLSCFGNHDGLVLGTAIPTAGYEEVLSGTRKPIDWPEGVDPLSHEAEFTSAPELLLEGPALEVGSDPGRRSVGRRDFVAAHLQAAGNPTGHGFQQWNVEAETAYGVYDIDGPVPVRVILLDTTNLDGNYQGSIGARQSRWLEERLVEVHAQYFDNDGDVVRTRTPNRLVVLASHHGLDTMVNERHSSAGLEQDHPRVTGLTLEAVLHRFGNVVLWLNGHRHLNEVQPRPDRSGRTNGFWEVSTAAMADWPCQSRLVEVVASRASEIAILCTMVDSDVPADPDGAEGRERLAAFHRELASNSPFSGAGFGREGQRRDRNLALRLRAPFVYS